MRFGFESEKILYNHKRKRIYTGVYRLVDTLEEYEALHGEDSIKRVSSEFVTSMVEIASSPTPSPFEVARDYLRSYTLVAAVCERENTTMLPMGSYPIKFRTSMAPKWRYYIQNAILSGDAEAGWDINRRPGMADAANCAGVHVHAEIETLPEFLIFGRELADKHNMGLMMTPLVAFASSPYFAGTHRAMSMRALRYYYGVYKAFPRNGSLPPVMKTSGEVLRYYLGAIEDWIRAGEKLGFATSDMQRLIQKQGANWSMIRWNRKWNTIELRCLDSDFVDMDVAKFTLVSGAMRRLDLGGEALKVEELKYRSKRTRYTAKQEREYLIDLIQECFEVRGKTVTILPTQAIHKITWLALTEGLKNEAVEAYILKLYRFAEKGTENAARWLLTPLKQSLHSGATTADHILHLNRGKKQIDSKAVPKLLLALSDHERSAFERLKRQLPDAMQPEPAHPFPV